MWIITKKKRSISRGEIHLKVKLWEVEFGKWTSKVVKAPNAKCAMETAIKNRKRR